MTALATPTAAPVDRVNVGLRRFPFYLTTNRPDALITMLAYGVSDILSVGINGDGEAVVWAFSADFQEENGAALINLVVADGDNDVPLCSSSVHIGTIFGDNLRPYHLPVGLEIDQLRRIKVRLTNQLNDTNSIRLCFRSSRDANRKPQATIDMLRAKARARYPYWYTLDNGWATLTAGQRVDVGVTIQDDADFRLKQISGISDGAYLINILDANTGEAIFIARGDTTFLQDSTILVGSRFYPFRLHQPRMFKAGQKIIVQLQDTSNAANTIYLSLGGEKLARS